MSVRLALVLPAPHTPLTLSVTAVSPQATEQAATGQVVAKATPDATATTNTADASPDQSAAVPCGTDTPAPAPLRPVSASYTSTTSAAAAVPPYAPSARASFVVPTPAPPASDPIESTASRASTSPGADPVPSASLPTYSTEASAVKRNGVHMLVVACVPASAVTFPITPSISCRLLRQWAVARILVRVARRGRSCPARSTSPHPLPP